MNCAVPISTLAVFIAFRVLAQSAAAPPAFEVADIKPSAANDVRLPGKGKLGPGGRVEIPHTTLKEFMIGAYGVQPDMIVGGPKWLDVDRFDLIAKAPDPNTPVPTLLSMLRTLLEERFKLVTHRENRVMAAYVLTVGKGGSKLRETTSSGSRQNCSTSPARDGSRERPLLRRECHNMTAAELARELGLPGFGLERQVVDETRLTGAYDFEFDFTRQTAVSSDAGREGGVSSPADLLPGPTIFEAMAQLGLRLEPTKRPIAVIVIDSATKPGEN
jgi:uncharacterized protein (TIGR03435 family)